MRRTVVAIAALGALAASSSASSQTAYVGYPNSIAVLGHSGSTGENSDPRRPGFEARANSWATGTNPKVNSVYLRILAKNPRIKGHNYGFSQGGAGVRELLQQAHTAVSTRPKPELLLVQIMDNDIVCPAAASDYSGFRAGVVAALKVLTRGLSASRIFLVSQLGSPGTWAKSLTRTERLSQGGEGPCDFISPTGKIIPSKAKKLDGVVHGYESQLARACKPYRQCRYDGGAFGRVVDKREYLSSDLNHLSVRGHAKAAAVAWAALKRAGFVPR